MGELPMVNDVELSGMDERREYAVKEMKRVYDDNVFNPDTRELFYLLSRILTDNKILLQSVKAQKHYINLNIH